MQSKPVTSVAVLMLVVASLLISGCTTTNTGTLPPAGSATLNATIETPTYTSTSSTNGSIVSPTEFAHLMTINFQNKYDSGEAVVIQPFTYNSVDGKDTFTAVINDGRKKLHVWQHNITYTLCKDREEARSVFAQEKTNAQNKSYGDAYSSDTFYHAYIGTYDAVGSKEVTINVCSPESICGHDYYQSFAQYFQVAVDYKTRLE